MNDKQISKDGFYEVRRRFWTAWKIAFKLWRGFWSEALGVHFDSAFFCFVVANTWQSGWPARCLSSFLKIPIGLTRVVSDGKKHGFHRITRLQWGARGSEPGPPLYNLWNHNVGVLWKIKNFKQCFERRPNVSLTTGTWFYVWPPDGNVCRFLLGLPRFWKRFSCGLPFLLEEADLWTYNGVRLILLRKADNPARHHFQALFVCLRKR